MTHFPQLSENKDERRTEEHGAKGRAHSGTAIELAEFHSTNDQTGNDFSGLVSDVVFSALHVEGAHVTKPVTETGRGDTLDAEGAEGTIMTGERADDRSSNRRRVHARLVVMVE